MIRGGAVSVTFRELRPEEIITLVDTAGLEGIEWGGDLHVPHGDRIRAAETGRMTRDAGLEVVSYGSYYRAGVSEEQGLPFERVLATAAELGAPLIRVWAGPSKPLAEYTPADREAVAVDALRIAAAAAAEGIGVAFEYHRNSLTETNASAAALLRDLPHPALGTYWQPPNDMDFDYCLEGLVAVLPRLAHLHVFHWIDRRHQFPLAEGEARWRPYLETVRREGVDCFALLEFVKDDSPAQFLEDARVLRSWLSPV